jgi:hypothetical protein
MSMPASSGVDPAVVTWGNVCMPAGKFLLVRHGSFVAAIRFFAIHTTNTPSPMDCADYEMYERTDGIGVFREGRVHRSAGHVSALSSHGVHPFVVQDGIWRIRTADITLTYEGNSCLALPSGGVKVAPTQWTDIADVGANETSLRWFMADPGMTREPMQILIERGRK